MDDNKETEVMEMEAKKAFALAEIEALRIIVEQSETKEEILQALQRIEDKIKEN